MLVNGKEVNNLIINGERFTKSYDDLIGKKMKIPSRNYSAHKIELHNDSYTDTWVPNKTDSNGNEVPFQIVEITGWRYATKSQNWTGLWLCGDMYTDAGSFLWTNLWVKSIDVIILN